MGFLERTETKHRTGEPILVLKEIWYKTPYPIQTQDEVLFGYYLYYGLYSNCNPNRYIAYDLLATLASAYVKELETLHKASGLT
jgi:hypothetical protein